MYFLAQLIHGQIAYSIGQIAGFKWYKGCK